MSIVKSHSGWSPSPLWLALLVVGAALAQAGGCKERACLDLPPALEVTFTIDKSVPDPKSITEVQVDVEGIKPAGVSGSQTLSVGRALDDGHASFVVSMGEHGKAGFEVSVTVTARDKGARVVAWGQKSFSGSADACNFESMTLGKPGADGGVDAGADAGDLMVDLFDAGRDLTDAAPPVDTKAWPDKTPWPDKTAWPDQGPLCAKSSWKVMKQALHNGNYTSVWGSSATNVFMVAGPVYQYDGNNWKAHKPGGKTVFNTVHGTGAGDVYAVGDHDEIYKYDGAAWTMVFSHKGAKLRGVWAMGTKKDVYAVGTNGTILHYDGKSWKKETSGTSVTLYGVWGSGSVVYAVGAAGTVLRRAGTAWIKVAAGVSENISDIWGSGPSSVFLTASSRIRRFDGSKWDDICTKTIGKKSVGYSGIWGSSPTDVFFSTGYGLVAHFDGKSCSYTRTYEQTGLSDVWGSGPSDVYAVGWGAQILHYDGAKWRQHDDSSFSVYSGWGSSATDMWVVGYSSAVLRYDGKSWTNVDFGRHTERLLSVWGTSSTNVYVVGRHGVVGRFDGKAWTHTVPFSPYADLNDVWGTGPSNVYVVGQFGNLYRFDGKKTWTTIKTSTGESLHGVWGTSTSNIYVIGNKGVMIHYDGIGWSTDTTTFKQKSLNGIWGDGPSNIFIVGEDCSVFHFDGKTWNHTTICSGVLSEVIRVSPMDAFAVGGTSLYWFNGTKWYTRPSPVSNGFYTTWKTPGSNQIYAAGDGAIITLTCP